ncbi:exonuclease SbcC [Yersinia enterocolitica]|uniref:exonuclease SbcC n=1 Tax=Yersinia enterocolitica TaxID=630 RepID=UPI00338F1BF8
MSVKSDIENTIKKSTEQLSIINIRLLSLRSQFNQSNHLFEEISLHKIKLKELVAVTTETDAALSLIKAQQEITQTELNKITSLNIDCDSLIKSSSDLDGFDPERIKDLNLLARELSTLQSHEQTIRQTQNTLNQQMSLHEKLISAGLEFLSISPTNICPLCRTNHESTLSLKAIIENNDLVSGLAKENYRLIEQSLLQQKNINSKMLLIVSEALDYRSNKISTLQIKLKELAEEISTEVYKNKTAAAQIKNVTAVLDKLQNETFNVEKSEFITSINNEINLFSTEIHKHESIINECRLLLSKNETTIIDINSELNSVTTSESTLKVNLYLSNNGLLAKELHDNCYEKTNVLNKLKNEYEEMVRSAEIQCSHIHSRMIENGTWIEFDELTRNLNELDVTIKKAQFDVYDYFYSIEKLVQVEISHDITSVESAIAKTIIDIDNEKDLIDSLIKKYELLLDHIKAFKPYIKSLELRQSLIKLEKDISQHESAEAILREELNNTLTELKNKVDSFFFTELINSIYKKIDPHPTFKEVEFRPSFDEPERPVLHIVLKDAKGEYISPILYFSAAQMNILSLSVFLANALHARDDNGTPLDVIMIDDPIQSMDSINVLSMIDLLRSISIRFNKQIIISTHDENFFELLQRKIPANALGSKFLKLEKFGVVVPVEPISE